MRLFRLVLVALVVGLVVVVLFAILSDDDNAIPTTTSEVAGEATTTTPADDSVRTTIPGYDGQRAEVEEHMFTFVMSVWQPNRHSVTHQSLLPWHDWTTDGCSKVPDSGFSFDFTHPCHRHDFGYRNLKRLESAFMQDAWNELEKRRVDDRFLEDMQTHCAARSSLQKPICLGFAQAYYWGVRTAGNVRPDG